MSLSGQWKARYKTSNNQVGTLIVELDELHDHYEGTAYLWNDNANIPGAVVALITPTKNDDVYLRQIPIFWVDHLGFNLTEQNFNDLIAKGAQFPNAVDINFKLNNGKLYVKWVSSTGTGSAIAPKIRSSEPSKLKALKIPTWDKFKVHVNKLESKRYIYRGQEDNTWRLRTSFFRTGRSDLRKVISDDVPNLHRHLSSITQFPLNLNDPIHYASFLNLAQHHG